MLRVVLDTNIFVSSVFWKGKPYNIVQLAFDDKIKVCVSLEILQELERVLRRNFQEENDFIKSQINLILEYAEVINVVSKINAVKEDPDDDKIIECAVDSKADYIVTGDPHLLNFKEFKGIKIVNAAYFVKLEL